MGAVRRGAVRFAIALVLGGALHVAWVALVVTGASLSASGITRGALWFAGPIMTAAGFTAGLTIRVRGALTLKKRLSHVYVVALIACAVGAVAGRPIGPMFVGLGTLTAGALAALALAIQAARGHSETPPAGSAA